MKITKNLQEKISIFRVYCICALCGIVVLVDSHKTQNIHISKYCAISVIEWHLSRSHAPFSRFKCDPIPNHVYRSFVFDFKLLLFYCNFMRIRFCRMWFATSHVCTVYILLQFITTRTLYSIRTFDLVVDYYIIINATSTSFRCLPPA